MERKIDLGRTSVEDVSNIYVKMMKKLLNILFKYSFLFLFFIAL